MFRIPLPDEMPFFTYHCSICDTIYYKKEELDAHTYQFHRDQIESFKCPKCSKPLKDYFDFQSHLCEKVRNEFEIEEVVVKETFCEVLKHWKS